MRWQRLEPPEGLRQNRRANPKGQATPPTVAARAKSDKDKIIDRVDDAAAAIADGDDDEVLDILNGLLDDYDDGLNCGERDAANLIRRGKNARQKPRPNGIVPPPCCTLLASSIDGPDSERGPGRHVNSSPG